MISAYISQYRYDLNIYFRLMKPLDPISVDFLFRQIDKSTIVY